MPALGTALGLPFSSPFGGFGGGGNGGPKALQFEGVDRDGDSCGLDCGVTGFGWASTDLSGKVKAKIRRFRTGEVEVICGKWGDSNPSANYLLYVDAADKLVFAVMNSTPATITAVGTTSLLANVNYDVEGEWTGTSLNVKLNGVQEGTQPALTLLQAPDGTTPFAIGREIPWNGANGQNPYEFKGIIADVENWSAGVLRGRWLCNQIDGGTTTPDNSGNNRHGTLVGLNKPILVPRPF